MLAPAFHLLRTPRWALLTFASRCQRTQSKYLILLHLYGDIFMAKVTLIFAVLLIILGLGFYLGTGSKAPTALIPTWFGVALGVFGMLAISPNEGRRKLFMHINVTIGLLGFLAVAGRVISVLASGRTPDQIALIAQLLMAGLLLIYVILCVRSFIAARRARLV
jgi:hypothetical protein